MNTDKINAATSETINASQMQAGDLIYFNGAIFKLGEVVTYKDRDGDGVDVFYSIGICEHPRKDMIENPYFYDALTGIYSFGFQGNSKRLLLRLL